MARVKAREFYDAPEATEAPRVVTEKALERRAPTTGRRRRCAPMSRLVPTGHSARTAPVARPAVAGRAQRLTHLPARTARQKTLSGRNWTERRGPACGDLGDGVLPGALAAAAHDEQVAVAHLDAIDSPPPRAAAARSRRGSPTETIATIVSWVQPRPMRVAVPGDAVAAVAVVAAAGGAERLAQLVAVVRR